MNKEQFESEMKRAVDKEIEKIPAIVNKLCKKAYGRDKVLVKPYIVLNVATI